MDQRSKQKCRLVFMLVLTFLFFLIEITTGYITGSLALISDSFHMISDVIALAIGLACLIISTRESKKNTYGWVRAEVLGALINSVFLMALCFSIFTEAIQRLVQPEIIQDPELLFIVGVIGLAINIIGLLMFCGDATGHGHSHGGLGHSHGGHGHSHGGHGHSHESDVDSATVSVVVDQSYREVQEGDDIDNSTTPQEIQVHSPKVASSSQMNIHGVFLHIIGDALGSLIVIISAVVIKYVEGDWKYRLDPAMSLCMVAIIMTTTVPLFLRSAKILLQNVPNHIRVSELERKLTDQVDGILGIHELHIWQLAGSRIIASLHIRCQNLIDYKRIAKKLKDFFHDEGIHSTTIQPEFVDLEGLPPRRECALECGPDQNCFDSTCCSIKKVHGNNPDHNLLIPSGDDNQVRIGASQSNDICNTSDETDSRRVKSDQVSHI